MSEEKVKPFLKVLPTKKKVNTLSRQNKLDRQTHCNIMTSGVHLKTIVNCAYKWIVICKQCASERLWPGPVLENVTSLMALTA